MSAVLHADWIGKRFGERRILSAATLAAAAGEIVVLLGRNGCGKTTLLRICAGMLRADHGVLRYRGDVIRRPRLHRLARRGLFLLPERGLLARGRALEDQLMTVARRYRAKEVPALLERFALDSPGLLESSGASLSTGERRRAEVVMALLRDPVCLLADEPLQGITPRDADLMADAFRSLAARGCAVVVTGHEVPSLLDLADRIVWMSAGTTHDLGTVATALENHSFRREYLERADRP